MFTYPQEDVLLDILGRCVDMKSEVFWSKSLKDTLSVKLYKTSSVLKVVSDSLAIQKKICFECQEDKKDLLEESIKKSKWDKREDGFFLSLIATLTVLLILK